MQDGNGQEITSAEHIANLNPFRYRGYYFDSDTGLYYLQSRYYDPQICRFINTDTTGILEAKGDLYDKNLFAYCDNNPVARVDYGGEFWHIVAGAVVGGLIEGVLSAVSQKMETGSINWGIVGVSVASGAITGAPGSTGLKLGAMVAINAGVSMAENTAEQVIENKGFDNFSIGKVALNGVVGAVSGATGGAGNGTKSLMNLGKQSVKRTAKTTIHKGVNPGLK